MEPITPPLPRRRWLLLLGVVLAAVALVYLPLHGGDVALATGPQKTAAWRLTVTFPAGQIQALLRLRAFDGVTNYQTTLDISPTCVPEGTAVILPGVALLGQSGRVVCQMPDLAVEFAQLTNGNVQLGGEATCTPFVNGWARVQYNPGASVAGDANPIFHHPDVSYGAPTLPSGPPTSTLRLEVEDIVRFSQPFTTTAGANGVRSILNCDPNRCVAAHVANGVVKGVQVSAPELMQFHTAATPVYLGYTPRAGGLGFPDGRLRVVDVDPGCSMVGN